MFTAAEKTDKRLVALIVFIMIGGLALILAPMMGCSPSESKSDTEHKTEQESPSGATAMDGQLVDWTMQSDCATCHTTEAGAMEDAAYAQAVAHQKQTCTDCHTEEPVLRTAHEGITYGDKPASKPTVLTVPEQTCIDCHGSMAEMATVTTGSVALTDSNGTSVNPHERPEGQTHEENPATCTDCHNNHSKTMERDAMKYCAKCHHRGVFTCGNCHEIRK